MTNQQYNYELFFEHSLDLLCIAGFDGYFKKVNLAVSQLLGYSFEELYSRPIEEFMHPDDRAKTLKFREKLIQAQEKYQNENRYVTRNGEVVWLSWTAIPMVNEQMVFAIAKDVTHKNILSAEREELIFNMKKLISDLKQLSYSASHDLRAPLSTLLALMDRIDMRTIKDPKTVKILEVIKVSGLSLKTNVDNYIDALKRDHQDEPDGEMVNLPTSLEKVRSSIKALLNLSNARFHIDFSEIHTLYFNQAYMESLLMNLITNSIKYAQPDKRPEISIKTQSAIGSKQLIYRDNGMGFDMEKVGHKLFEIHETFHENVDSKGIGLFLIKSYVKRFGGSITVNSKVNEGTEFVISFPDQAST